MCRNWATLIRERKEYLFFLLLKDFAIQTLGRSLFLPLQVGRNYLLVSRQLQRLIHDLKCAEFNFLILLKKDHIQR